MENIYSMGLHETIYSKKPNSEIIRVSGGWIYRFHYQSEITIGVYVDNVDSVFIPFSNEFEDDAPK